MFSNIKVRSGKPLSILIKIKSHYERATINEPNNIRSASSCFSVSNLTEFEDASMQHTQIALQI